MMINIIRKRQDGEGWNDKIGGWCPTLLLGKGLEAEPAITTVGRGRHATHPASDRYVKTSAMPKRV